MIKMTDELFKKLTDKQEILDTEIREKHDISPDNWLEDLDINHKLALRGEVSEFINEARDLWKYWKKKKPNMDQLIDEAVDVIHFLHLMMNKREFEIRWKVTYLNRRIEHFRALTYRGPHEKTFEKIEPDYRKYLNYMYNVDTNEDLIDTYAILLVVLDYYCFTLEDIEKAYDKKNEENRQRQESGY
ncbi:hypothetical protein CW685_01875 [Macrococcoides caseolyticum]|uniref:dUTP diphosphatase n=1 Tax=Macrococcoides caseolyticum TaxID=69966 RepID=UPI000C34BA71|nr:dUTP diphosphatase [Macrococcus caseolyticus]PKE12782.1 hypothetical protein CW685_01875 [Macrococcus caseolyticus]